MTTQQDDYLDVPDNMDFGDKDFAVESWSGKAPLTDSQINEALALGMGWYQKEVSFGMAWFDGETHEFREHIPEWSPCSSLDQMHLVETRIFELGLMWKYTEAISLLCDYIQTRMIHATARQKSLAAVKVFGEVGK